MRRASTESATPRTQKRLCGEAGIEYAGWVPNFEVPQIFARYRVTVHVPRRPYATALPGVPTIRVFEALACGIPLGSAPWTDSEDLFTPGRGFLFARDGADMQQKMLLLLQDRDQAREISRAWPPHDIEPPHLRHRVKELYSILDEVGSPATTMAGGVN